MKIVGLGAGGHAKVMIEALRELGGYEIVGLLDARRELHGECVLGVRVLGDDLLLPELRDQGVRRAFIGLGGVGDTEPRRLLYRWVHQQGLEVVRVIHPRSIVSPSAEIGRGSTVLAASVIGAAVRLGENVLVNTGALVEHDCLLGDHVHVATGARLGGGVDVGAGAHIGLGASVRQGLQIGRNALVGAGAAVVEDVPASVVVAGVPAKVLRRVDA